MNDRRMLRWGPASLPVGAVVGRWRVVGWAGRGTYGAVYRAEPLEPEAPRPVALKLALSPEDPRFEREAALLSRVRSPHVPTLHAHGRWEHAGRAYPYLVMQWMEGRSLYEWAEAPPPTSRQALRLLAGVARALEATHAAGGVHRDVKGDNLLVQPEEARAFLVDFGASHYTGAAPLTWQPLPPGTPAYRSPEAWRFVREMDFDSLAHYAARPADDVFALGVSAYRWLTGEYPPPVDPLQDTDGVWRVGGVGLKPPSALSPRVDAGLSALILRMLSVAPEVRGTARELAEALEREAEGAGPDADLLLFTESRPAATRQEVARKESVELVRVPTPSQPVQRRETARVGWHPLVLATGGLALVLGAVWAAQQLWMERSSLTRDEARDASPTDAGTAGLAGEAIIAPQETAEVPPRWAGPGAELPKRPFPGQRRPDSSGRCRTLAQVVINGGCWVEVTRVKPPCDEESYEWKGACYYPVLDRSRQPTAGEP